MTKVDRVDAEDSMPVVDFFKSRALLALKKSLEAPVAHAAKQAEADEEEKDDIVASLDELKTQCFESLIAFHIKAISLNGESDHL